MAIIRMPVSGLALAALDSCSVYVLLKDMGEGVYLKIGIASDPVSRLKALIHGLPFDPDVMSYYRMRSRPAARQMEKVLLRLCRKWQTRGEWHWLQHADAAAFRPILASVGQRFVRRAHSDKWHTIEVADFRHAQAEARKANIRTGPKAPRKWSLHGLHAKAYADFKRGSAEKINGRLVSKLS